MQGSKTRWLVERLNEIQDRQEKAIVFTHHRRLQRLLQVLLEAKFQIRPTIINGDVDGRQKLIDDFEDSPGFNVIILSGEAAGVGINVTAANHVVHFSRMWNPAKENQATDRAYRIGQTRDVYVHKPVATLPGQNESLDERLDELIAAKAELADEVIRPTKEMKVQRTELSEALS